MRKLQKYFLLSEQGYSDLKKGIIACTITNLSLMLPFAATVLLLKELLNPLFDQEINPILLWVYFGFALLGAVAIFFASMNDYENTYVSAYKESEKTRINTIEHIRKLPMSVFNSKNLSDLTTNIMADAEVSEHVMSHIVPQLCANCISITIICTLLTFAEWRLSLAIFFTVPLALGSIYIAKKLNDYLGSIFVQKKLQASKEVQEYMDGMKVIKACNLNGEKAEHLKNALKQLKSMSIKYEFINGTLLSGAQVFLQIGIGIVVLVGVNLLVNGNIDFLILLSFLLIVTRIYGPILTVMVLLPELLYHTLALKRTKALMDIQIMEGCEDIEFPNFNISFDDVSFKYNDDDTLQHITTTINEGEVTALVGPSGSGKTTMTKLIARFWDTTSGSVTIGGIDIKEVEPEYLLSYISFVFQDVVLFSDSIYNNILIGNKSATKEQVIAAAKAAQCDTFVSKLKDGYDTIIGENGATLSGGERQRISIARAILKDAPIILLDEATASIDPGNEAAIQTALSTLIAEKTVIVIAHRIHTVADCDKIIVLDQGKLVEEGTHEILLNNKNLYAKLYDIQQKATNWTVN